jgi:hypothetical protein
MLRWVFWENVLEHPGMSQWKILRSFVCPAPPFGRDGECVRVFCFGWISASGEAEPASELLSVASGFAWIAFMSVSTPVLKSIELVTEKLLVMLLEPLRLLDSDTEDLRVSLFTEGLRLPPTDRRISLSS